MEKTAFEENVRLHSKMIYQIAYSYLKSIDDANDIVQDVLIKLLVTDKPFESPEHVRNWLVRVTINECKKVFRAPWQKRENLDDYINELFYEQPDYQDLYTAIMKLDRKYRIPLILCYCDGYSTKEIASLLNIPENTVSTYLRRGKEKMRKYMKEEP